MKTAIRPMFKWIVTNKDTGKSVEVEAVNASKAVNIAHKTLKDGSVNEYTWIKLLTN